MESNKDIVISPINEKVEVCVGGDTVNLLCEALISADKGLKITVTDADQDLYASWFLKELRKKRDTIEEARLAITRPLDAAKKRIMDSVSPTLKKLEAVDTALTKTILEYREKKEKERQAALKVSDEKALLEAKENNSVLELVENMFDCEKDMVTQKTWTYRVTDISKVNKKYILENSVLLNKLAKQTCGQIEEPGIEFYEKVTLRRGVR